MPPFYKSRFHDRQTPFCADFAALEIKLVINYEIHNFLKFSVLLQNFCFCFDLFIFISILIHIFYLESNPQDTENTKDDTKKEKKEPKVLDKVIDPLTDAPKAEDVPSTSVGGKTCSSFTIPFKSKIVGAKRKISDLQVNISDRFICL